MAMVAVRGGCVCGSVGGGRGGATIFLTYQRGGLELFFFVLEGCTV